MPTGVPDWFLKDLRSSIISFTVSTVCTTILAYFIAVSSAETVAKDVAEQTIQREKKFFAVNIAQNGVGFPAIIFEKAAEEGYVLQFVPPELKNVGVCEYYAARGDTFGDMALNYISSYRQCFKLRRLGEKSYEVTANAESNQLSKKGEDFFCQCLR